MSKHKWRRRPNDGSAPAWCRHLDGLFRTGDHKLLLELLEPEIRDAIHRISGLTPEQRDDVVNTTCVHLLEEWARGRTYGSWSIVAVARSRAKYVALDLFQELKEPERRGFKVVPLDYAFPTHDSDGENKRKPVEPVDPHPEPHELAEDEELKEKTLNKLPPRDREVFRLRCFEGLGSAEVAKRLGCKPNAVDQAYHRAKQRLLDDGLAA